MKNPFNVANNGSYANHSAFSLIWVVFHYFFFLPYLIINFFFVFQFFFVLVFASFSILMHQFINTPSFLYISFKYSTFIYFNYTYVIKNKRRKELCLCLCMQAQESRFLIWIIMKVLSEKSITFMHAYGSFWKKHKNRML